MKASIQTKLLVMCILLILLTAVSISGAYYVLTTQDKHRESRQHIQIAFKIILDDIANLKKSYATNVGEFLQQDIRLSWFANYYKEDEKKLASSTFILSSVLKAANALKDFGPIVSADRLTFYGENKRLLLVYQRHDDGDTVGGYVTSETGHDTYLPMDDFSTLTTYSDHPIPDVPLPPDLSASYQEDIPDTILTSLFSDGRRIGIKVTAPVYRFKKKAGVLVGEIWYTQSMVERYASLSETAIDFFAGTQFSIGNLAGQTAIAPETLAQLPPCEEILSNGVIDVVSVAFKNEDYYQGRCALKHDQHTVGAIHISLSQQIEKQEVKHILQAVTLISFVVILFAVGLSVLFSRKTIHSIHNIVEVIGSAAEGDLRKSAQALTQDEIGMLARKLNRMIMQLRTISGQVQQGSQSVNITAETILNQMDALIQHMGQQTESVDNTKTSIEKINTFIDTVAHNTNELLAAAEQILSAIQETRASIHEVTTSTGTLTVNVQLISSSVEQVNQSVKLISENAGHLEDIARHTETEIHHMDQSFKDVSLNADRSRQLAKETMDAAISGQESVDASIQGMLELKGVVANTAQIIREVNSWGEQVSSILNIVDDITEQTSLLSLNASIISAQAGEHGRGFAVVANEIKELATRTKVSTHEIGTLIRKLQLKTEEGVNNTIEGIAKADQGMQLAHAVQDALNTILERATRSSNRASDTTEVIQQTVASSQTIRTQMSRITEMVSNIRKAIQEEEQDIEQVVSAVENISGMSEQVSHASSEQQRAAEEIEHSMGHVTKQFSDISNQTQALKQNSSQIVAAMRIIESTTEQILQDTTHLSEDTIKNLVQQSEVLRNIVHVFKIS